MLNLKPVGTAPPFWPILGPGRAAGTKAQPRPDQPSSTAQDQAPRQRSVPPAIRTHTHTLERASVLNFKPAVHRAPFWRSCWPILEPGGATGTNGQSDQPSSPAKAPGTSWRSILPAIHTHTHYRENRHENLSRQCTAPYHTPFLGPDLLHGCTVGPALVAVATVVKL